MTKKKHIQILLFIMIINSVIESLLMSFENRSIIILIQYISNLVYIVPVVFLTKRKKTKHRIITLTLFFIAYLFGLSIFSSNLILSGTYLIKFIIPLLYFIVGIQLFKKEIEIDFFIRHLWILLAYFCVYISISNIFDIGDSLYRNGLKVGYYSINGLYIPCVCFVIILFNLKKQWSKQLRILNIALLVFTFLIFLILLKRTIIILFLLSIAAYIYQRRLFLKIGVIGIVIISFSLLFLQNDINNFELNVRNGRFSKNYNVLNEGRFTENQHLISYIAKSKFSLVFGTGEVFNDKKFTSQFYEKEREAHNSFIRILWSSGLLGLILFLSFYYLQFKLIRKYFRYYKRNKIRSLTNFLFFIQFLIAFRLINDFSSGITYLGYNSISYLLIGGAINIGKNQINNTLQK